MKKILFVVLLLLAGTSIVNAQIKIVGDDYSDSLTATKNYYDRDVDFDRFFPAISPREAFGLMGFNLQSGCTEVNLIGDTLYLYQKIICEPTDPSFSIRQNGYAEPLNMPVGYYVIDGYVFCTDRMNDIRESVGLKRIEGCESSRSEYGSSIKGLKEDILTGKLGLGEMGKYINYIVLHSVDDQNDNRISYYLFPWIYPWKGTFFDWYVSPPIIGNLQYFIPVRFYNEARKFIGKEVILTYGYNSFYDIFEGIRDSIFEDRMTHEKMKLQDTKYACKDIVMKSDGRFYAILNGEKTGSFAVELERILYARNVQDVPPAENYWYGKNENNRQKDIACLMARDIGYIIESKNITILTNRAKKAKSQREKEKQQWESARKREQQQQEAAFVQKMTAKYGVNFGELVGKKQVAIGMSKEMCRDAWGNPMNTYRTTTKYGKSEVWCYNYKTRVYFYNGKVVQIDD